MKTTIYKIFAALVLVASIMSLVSCHSIKGEIVDDDHYMVQSKNVVVTYSDKDGYTFWNKITSEKIQDGIEWVHSSSDTLWVFCAHGKRGFYNHITGEIVIQAQYGSAWMFSENLAAVEKDGYIGFIDHQGSIVIDYSYPYYGNPLEEFIFKNGFCVVANRQGLCGVIDKTGNWILNPEYDYVSAFKEYAIVTTGGIKKQVSYDGKVLNSLVLDDIEELTYYKEEYYTDYDERTVKYYTGLYAYKVGDQWGIMDSKCNRLTEPVYAEIEALDDNVFRATLLDNCSGVILNSKGEMMK